MLEKKLLTASMGCLKNYADLESYHINYASKVKVKGVLRLP